MVMFDCCPKTSKIFNLTTQEKTYIHSYSLQLKCIGKKVYVFEAEESIYNFIGHRHRR